MAATLSYQALVTSGTGASSYSLAFTAAAATGQERLVAIFGISNGNNTTIAFSSVTIDGQSATAVGSHVRASDGSANGPVVAFFRAAGTSSTSFNVAYSCSNAMFDGRAYLWSLNDAGTLLNTGSAFFSNDVTGALSLNLNTVANGAAAAALHGYIDVSPTTTWAGLTERADTAGLYANDWQSAADLNAGSTSTPLTVTATPSATKFGGSALVGLAVSFNPGGTGTTLTAAAGSYAGSGSPAPLAYRLTAEGAI